MKRLIKVGLYVTATYWFARCYEAYKREPYPLVKPEAKPVTVVVAQSENNVHRRSRA